MTATQIIQLLVAAQQLLIGLPALVEQFKATMSSEDEAALKAELAKLRASNTDAYNAAVSALDGIIQA